MKRIFDSQLIGPFAAMIIVAVVVALTTDRFLNPGNLSNLSLQVSIVALIAIGSTIVIFAAGIDLSSGSMVALLTMILAQMLKFMGIPLAIALPLTLALGALFGLVLGVITAYGRIPAFITTLAALIAFRGLALTFNNGSPIFSLDPALEPVFYGKFIGIPLPFFYLVFFYGLAAFMMNFTKLGREIYAVGGNPSAAVLTGINVRKVQAMTFVIAGFMTAVGAVLMSARLNSGSPNYGQTLELQAIAAAVVGGASLAGGRGNILATLMGAMTIVIVQNGLNLNAAPSSVQNIVLGIIILMAVGIDMWRVEISAVMSRILGKPKPTPTVRSQVAIRSLPKGIEMDLGLKDKLVLVTGSGSGIGKATARTFLEEGARVVVHGLTAAEVDACVAELSEVGEVTGGAGDLTDPSDASALCELAQNCGPVDVLVNNVGIFSVKPFEELTDEEWMRYFDINVLTAVRMSRVLLPAMLKRGMGSIVNLASEAGVKPLPQMVHYSVTKTAMLGLTRGMAELTKGSGVRVNSVLPGPTWTEGVQSYFDGLASKSASRWTTSSKAISKGTSRLP